MKKSFTMMRRGRIQDLDRSFDLQFWQKQEPEARFAAAWELIVHACRLVLEFYNLELVTNLQ
jgi:hypothetical protein